MALVNQLRFLPRHHAEAADRFEVFRPDFLELIFAFASGEADIEVRKEIVGVFDDFGMARRNESALGFGASDA